MNKNIFFEQHLYAIKIADIYAPEVRKRLIQGKTAKTVFPSTDTLFNKDIIKENDPYLARNKTVKKKFVEEDQNYKNNSSKAYSRTPGINQRKDSSNHKKSENFSETSTKPSTEVDEAVNPTKDSGLTLERNSSGTTLDCSTKTPATTTIFSPKDRSRFNFVSEASSDEPVEIPKFIQTLIFKKVSRHNFTKHVRNIEEVLYTDKGLTAEYNNKNPWAHFIVENKTEDHDLEFIDDFEYINNLVLNKCKAHK